MDIRTFMLVLAIGNIGFAILMAGYARAGGLNGALAVWQWAKLVQGAAHMLAWLRPDYPNFAIALGSNLLLIVGVGLEVGAYCIFFGFQRWQRVLYPFTALALAIFCAAQAAGVPAHAKMALMSVIIALYTGAMSYALLRPRPERSLLQVIIGTNDLIFFVAISMRALSAIGDMHLTLFSASAVQSFTYLTGYSLMVVNSFGFLLLCKEKDDAKMALLATIDSLTGLVNRRAFFERTESARALALRMKKPISLLMIDIDHFKRLNDRFGHASGDEALCVFAETARGVLREHDILGRLGGEEFALVLPETDLDGALQAAERLRLAVSTARMPTSGNVYTMTVSIGVAMIDAVEHVNAALARADHALYAAKSAGRDRVVCGEPLLKLA